MGNANVNVSRLDYRIPTDIGPLLPSEPSNHDTLISHIYFLGIQVIIMNYRHYHNMHSKTDNFFNGSRWDIWNYANFMHL